MDKRFMVQGKQTGNREMVQGYYVPGYYADSNFIAITEYETYRTLTPVIVDPSTIEPVAATMEHPGTCPNCSKDVYCIFGRDDRFEFCMFCGQRMDWSGVK